MKALLVNGNTTANFSFDPVPCQEFCIPDRKIRQVTVYDYDDHTSEVRICDERFDVYCIVKFSTGCVFVAYERPGVSGSANTQDYADHIFIPVPVLVAVDYGGDETWLLPNRDVREEPAFVKKPEHALGVWKEKTA